MAGEDNAPRSLLRVMALFGTISHADDGVTLARLSQELDSPKSSLLALLRPLVAKGYLTHLGGIYRLGPTIFKLASDILATHSFPRLIRPLMQQLAERSKESVYLAVIDKQASCVTYVEAIESRQQVRYTAPVGAPRPLYCSAAGRLLLAYEDDAWRENYLRTVRLKPLTERTLTSRVELRKEIRRIRETGIAISIGEAVRGAGGIAAPVFDLEGKVTGALLIGAPVDRFERELPMLRALMQDLAAQTSGVRVGRPAVERAASRPRRATDS